MMERPNGSAMARSAYRITPNYQSLNLQSPPNHPSPITQSPMVKAECAVCEIHAESTFRIDGMDCREEVAILERRLKHLPGLEDFVADLVGQRLRVRYDAAKLSTSAISEAIGQTGMRAWLEHEHPVGHSAAATSRQVLVAISESPLPRGCCCSGWPRRLSFRWRRSALPSLRWCVYGAPRLGRHAGHGPGHQRADAGGRRRRHRDRGVV
jgi:copper chaperone CopZ